MSNTLTAPVVTTQTQAPVSYPYARTDKTAIPVPTVVVPSDVNAIFKDISFDRTIKRITNGTTGSSSSQGCAHKTPSSEVSSAWGRNSDRFYTLATKGTVEYFTLDTTTGNATYVRDLPFTTEPTFSRVQPSIIYGVTGFKILSYDTDTTAQTVIFDLAVIDPTYAVSGLYMGSLQSSASNPERITCFYGGSSQDKFFRVCVFEPANPSNRLILDTLAMTINGVAVSMLPFHVHAVGLDQSGRYVIVFPTQTDINNGVPQTYVWDTTTATLTGITVSGQGHACEGYGVHINKDTSTGEQWDAIQWQYRSLADVAHTTNIINPIILPRETYMSDHGQWNNARADAVTPFVSGTYRFHEDIPQNLSTDASARGNTIPWRPCDNEIISVHPTTGVIYRWGHHFACIYADSWVEGQSELTFWYEPIPQISPDGRWILFDSNMEKTLGLDVGSKDPQQAHRTDVFLIDTSIMPAVTIEDPSVLLAQLSTMQSTLTQLQTGLTTLQTGVSTLTTALTPPSN